MMKRIISLVLISILLFTSLSFSISAQDSYYSYNPEDAELLYALGVIEDPSVTPDVVTRAQFVRYTMKLSGIPLTPYKGTNFSDVPDSHSDYNYIMSAVDFGLISIADMFRPDDAIAPNEAFKIIVKLLGYDFMAEAKGGYPSGYLQTAQTIDLLSVVDTSALQMSNYDVCTLLCNALKLHLPEVSYTNEGATDYHIGTATILRKYRGIEEIRGVVDGVSHYSSYNASGMGDDKISINGVAYYTGSLNCDSLFGYDVVAYYNTKTKKLISCTPSDKNRILSIYAEDIESFSNGRFVYSDKDMKSKTAFVNLDTTIFYNGRIFDYDALKMLPESGSLTFVSPNGSASYSTLYIKSYKTIVVDRISKSEYILIDKYSDKNVITADPDKVELTVLDQDGIYLSFEDISVGDVVCAAISDDEKCIELVCVKDEFMGTYTGHSEGYIQVDGSSYRLSAALASKYQDLIVMGKQATFRLDIDQRIADIIPVVADNEQIGYLVVGKHFQTGMTSNLAVRILNLDGNIYDYEFAKVFSVNGKTYKDFKIAYDELKSSDYNSMLCGIVKFALDSDGKIKSVVYSDKAGGNGGLYVTNTIETSTAYHKFSKWFYCIGRDIICDTNLKVFKVPNPIYSIDNIDDDQYAIVQPTFITDTTAAGYIMEGYTTVEDDGMSQYLLMQKIADDNSVESAVIGNVPYMVSKISKTMMDGEEREMLELCNMHTTTSTPLKVYSRNENDFTSGSVQPGDIIRISRNEKNIVNAFKFVYKKGASSLADGSYAIMSSNADIQEMYIAMATPYRFRSSVLDVASADILPNYISESQLKPRYLPQSMVLKYDERLKRVVEVPTNEIKDYMSFGDAKNTIIYHMTNEALYSIFIVD